MRKSRIKKKKTKKPKDKRAKRLRSSPLSPGVTPKGVGKVNRVDARVQVLDLKRKGYPSSARLIDDGDVLHLERNGKSVDGRKRKAKCRTPTDPVNRSSPNLGRLMKEFPLVRLRPKGPLCGYLARLLRDKTDESFRVLNIVQDLLVGTAFESEFYYHACSPYLRGRAGKLLVSRKPSLGSSRLILTQLIRVRSNFPWKRLESVIGMGHAANADRI
jgi:hypothetical protein